MRKLNIISVSVFGVGLWLLANCLPAAAQGQLAGQVLVSYGEFVASQADKSERILYRSAQFFSGDTLRTGAGSYAQLRFQDGAVMALRENTEFRVDEYRFDPNNAEDNRSAATLIKGGFRTLTGLIGKLKPDAYRVDTPLATIGIRGTHYEALLQDGLYVGVWQGAVNVTNKSGLIRLGQGASYNFAHVRHAERPPVMHLRPPMPMQGSQQPYPLPSTQPYPGMLPPPVEGGNFNKGFDARLSAQEWSSLDRYGFVAFGGAGAPGPLGGRASDGVAGNPIFYQPFQNLVFRQGNALLGPVTTNASIPGYPVSWGVWSGSAPNGPVLLQPDPNDPSKFIPIARPVFWLTLIPTPLTAMPTGSVSYTTVLGSQVGGSGGGTTPTVSAFNATVNFSAGSLSGTMQVMDGTNTWFANFSGAVFGNKLDANLITGSSFVNSSFFPAQGKILGGFTGPSGNAIGGAFDFEEVGNPNKYVEGVFLAQ